MESAKIIVIFVILIILFLIIAHILRRKRVITGAAEKGLRGPRIVVAISGPRGIDLKKIGKTIARKIKGYAHVHSDREDVSARVSALSAKNKGVIITGHDLRDEYIPAVNEHIHLSYIPYSGARDLIAYKSVIVDNIQKFAKITQSEALEEYQKYYDSLGKTTITKIIVARDDVIDEILQEILLLKSAWEV